MLCLDCTVTEKKNIDISTPKIHKNISIFMNSIKKVIENLNSVSFKNANHQGNTSWEVKITNIYDKITNCSIIFKKCLNKFVKLSQLIDEKAANFGD